MKLPCRYVANSWQYTTIYDADNVPLCRFDLEDWDVTEENQDELERKQAELAELIVSFLNTSGGLSFTPQVHQPEEG